MPIIWGEQNCKWGWHHHWKEWMTDRLVNQRERFCKICGAYELAHNKPPDLEDLSVPTMKREKKYACWIK